MSGIGRRTFLRGVAAVGGGWALLGRTARATRGPLIPDRYRWLAGDLHCHTLYSSDVLGPNVLRDVRRGRARELLEAKIGFTPAEQITIAEVRGLDFLAITDHNTTRGLRDDGYASATLLLVPGYEHSLGAHGHVCVLGAERKIPIDRDRPDAPVLLRRAAERRGHLFIPTHPYSPKWPWQPARPVRPHAIEIWSGAAPKIAELVERWDREILSLRRTPAVGGSDSHYRARGTINGVGQPTTWVYARRPTQRSVLAAIRAGRTSVSMAPPAMGGQRLALQAEDGEALVPVGGTASLGRRLRIEAAVEGASIFGGARYVRLIVDGLPTQPVQVEPGTRPTSWDVTPERYVRAELLEGESARLLAFTSPIWVRAR